MQQSLQKIVTRRRDRSFEFDVIEAQAERRAYRAAPPKARKPLKEESPRVWREERESAR